MILLWHLSTIKPLFVVRRCVTPDTLCILTELLTRRFFATSIAIDMSFETGHSWAQFSTKTTVGHVDEGKFHINFCFLLGTVDRSLPQVQDLSCMLGRAWEVHLSIVITLLTRLRWCHCKTLLNGKFSTATCSSYLTTMTPLLFCPVFVILSIHQSQIVLLCSLILFEHAS